MPKETPQVSKKKRKLTPEIGVGAAAGASPFLGYIGQERSKNPYAKKVRKFKNINQARKHIRPGDVLLESVPHAGKYQGTDSIFTNITKNLTGSKFNHVEVVVPGKRGLRSTFAGAKKSGYKVDRALGTLASDGVAETRNRGYLKGDFVILRRKGKAPRGGQATKLYDAVRGSAEKDYWGEGVPKRAKRIIKKIDQKMIEMKVSAKRRKEIRGALRANADGWDSYGIALKEVFKPKVGKRKIQKDLNCAGGICSSTEPIAQHRAGLKQKPIVRAKAIKDALPEDYLRSKDFDIVGTITGKTKADPRRMKLRGVGTRAGIGLVLGGTAYGITKGIKKLINGDK